MCKTYMLDENTGHWTPALRYSLMMMTMMKHKSH